MYLQVGDEHYELYTNLGVAKRIEKRFKSTIMQIFSKIETAEVDEMVDLLSIASKRDGEELKEFKETIMDEFDYGDLSIAVQDFIIGLQFSGTPEQNEKKLEKFQLPEVQKNQIRKALGLPLPTPSTGKK